MIKNKKNFSLFRNISFLCLLILYFFLISFYLYEQNFFWRIPEEMSRKAIIVISLSYCFSLYGLIVLFEGINIGRRRIMDLCFGFFFAALCVNAVGLIILYIFLPSYFWRLCFEAFVITILESALGVLWVLVCHRAYEKYEFRKEAVFVYGNRENDTDFVQVNNVINRYFKISRAIDYRVGEEEIIKGLSDSSVVYVGDIPVQIRNTVVKYCMKEDIDCYSIPKVSDIYLQNAKIFQLNDKFLFRYPSLEIQGIKKAVKRGMDIVISALLLIIFSPAMGAIALAVKLTDRGPVFYTQDRVSRNGKEFKMYKFRSMKVNAETGGARMASREDPRITPVGRIIRNIHFDELPQLMNVLKGDMSLVGPRPERKEFIEEYSARIPEFAERLKVKGGLTGYAQVYGKYNTSPEDKIKMDLYYIYNYSLWMDIKILILTVRILFQKENTEGVDKEQINALKK